MDRPIISLRPYRPEDCAALAGLFYETVHAVNARVMRQLSFPSREKWIWQPRAARSAPMIR